MTKIRLKITKNERIISKITQNTNPKRYMAKIAKKKSVKNMIFWSKMAEKAKKGVKSRFFKNSMGSEVENQKFYVFWPLQAI